jgi:hypothetical protein
VISDGAWLRAGRIVLKGVTIGKNTIVGAGALWYATFLPTSWPKAARSGLCASASGTKQAFQSFRLIALILQANSGLTRILPDSSAREGQQERVPAGHFANGNPIL